ncbi:GntR family transcriptional regulator [Streptomyces sp. NPDC088817]|uniref:GntR family transcriptional regulator n=1 Tax=Streptomyces sp. NPDC088817 TaxID=3365907 RepID=UPI0038051588
MKQVEASASRRTGEEETLTLAERAYRDIRDRLIMLEIPPGAPVNEDLLAQSVGFGRTPVREALKRLQHERLIMAYPRRGTFATEVNITDLAHISEVRRQLEPMAAGRAADRATAADRQALGALLRGLEGEGTSAQGADALMRLDLRVHRAIYAATHNPYFEDTLIRYDNLATRIWCLFVDRVPGMAGHVVEHGPLLRAIVDGDPEKASELALSHVVGFERAIREAI